MELKKITNTILGRQKLIYEIEKLKEENYEIKKSYSISNAVNNMLCKELDYYKKMTIHQKLISIAHEIIETLPYGHSNHVIRTKDNFNVEIKQIGVDEHECWCDGAVVKRISIS